MNETNAGSDHTPTAAPPTTVTPLARRPLNVHRAALWAMMCIVLAAAVIAFVPQTYHSSSTQYPPPVVTPLCTRLIGPIARAGTVISPCPEWISPARRLP